MVWERRHGARARDAKIAYFRAHGAIPPSWADWVASAIDGWRELEDEATMAEQVRRLARETGLVDADAWERSLAALGDEET